MTATAATATREEVDRLAEKFLAEKRDLVTDPDRCVDWCVERSDEFVTLLHGHGIPATTIDGVRFGENKMFPGHLLMLAGHTAVLLTLRDPDTGKTADWVWDWTARQFDPATPVPLVQPLGEWRRDWGHFCAGSRHRAAAHLDTMPKPTNPGPAVNSDSATGAEGADSADSAVSVDPALLDEFTSKYPTLTAEECTQVALIETEYTKVRAQAKQYQERMTALDQQRRAMLRAAAERAESPEEIALAYRTTRQGLHRLQAVLHDLHPYLYDLQNYAPILPGQEDGTFGLRLTLMGDNNEAAEAEPLTEAVLAAARLLAPDGGLTVEEVENFRLNEALVGSLVGLHPVEVLEEDCGETRSLLVFHNADGSEALLLNTRRKFFHDGGVEARGSLVEVLTETLRQVREEQPEPCW